MLVVGRVTKFKEFTMLDRFRPLLVKSLDEYEMRRDRWIILQLLAWVTIATDCTKLKWLYMDLDKKWRRWEGGESI